MSLLNDIKKDRASIPLPERNAVGDTANKTERNKEICNRYWAGGITHAELAKEYNCSRKNIQQLLARTNEKLKKHNLDRENYTDN